MDHQLRRFVAVLAIVLLAPIAHAAAACSGWSHSAAERMACCESQGDHCAALSADDCCANGEARRNLETVSATTVSPGATIVEPVPPAVPFLRSSRAHLQPLTARPDTYLLDSVFLI